MESVRRGIWINQGLWEEIQRRAEEQHVSASSFVREAVIGRIAYQMGLEGNEKVEQAYELAKKLERN
jgi:hypothetical protein